MTKIKNWSPITKILLIICQIGCAYLFLIKGLNINSVADRVLSVLGIIASIVSISLINNNEIVDRLLLELNKYSFPIYLLYTIFTAGIRITLLKLGIDNYWIHVLLGTTGGIGNPIIGMNVIKNYDFLLFIFYPVKVLKDIKYSNVARRNS